MKIKVKVYNSIDPVRTLFLHLARVAAANNFGRCST